MARPPAIAAPTFFAEHFRATGTPERAAGEKAYLKSPLRFHGVTTPDIRRACADVCHERQGLDRERLRAEVDALMRTDFHDLRSAAIGVLELMGERAFFLRKAIGWVRCDVSKHRPQLTRDFLLEHGGGASGLTWREASRCLPATMREGLPGPATPQRRSGA